MCGFGGVEAGGIIFDRCGVFAAGLGADRGEFWRVTGISGGVGRKFFAVASRQFSRRIGGGISMDVLTGGKLRIRRRKISFSFVCIITDPPTFSASGGAGGDGTGVNGLRN